MKKSAINEGKSKKLRGKKRLFRKIEDEANAFTLDLGPDASYDLWSWQPDASGQGDASFFGEQVKCLFIAFDRVLDQVLDYPKAFQTWLVIGERNLIDNGVYFHTPSPDSSNFPIRFSDVKWDVSPPSFLEPFLEQRQLVFGSTGTSGAAVHFLYSVYHGIPLQ